MNLSGDLSLNASHPHPRSAAASHSAVGASSPLTSRVSHRRMSAYTLCALSLLAVLAFGTVACKQQAAVDPLLEAATNYKTAVEPALASSEGIARLFVQVVTESQGKPDPDKAVGRLETELLPKVKEFTDKVNAIQVAEPQIQEAHQYLVRVAKLRQEGYEQVVKGYKEKNLELFSDGQKKLRDSKIEEEEFSTRALQLMHSQGLELTIFSQAAVQ